MKVIRKFAIQGHDVPLTSHAPRGPFPPEVLAQPKMQVTEDHSDSLHSGLDEVKFFKCRDCQDILLGSELDDHECDE